MGSILQIAPEEKKLDYIGSKVAQKHVAYGADELENAPFNHYIFKRKLFIWDAYDTNGKPLDFR